VDRADNGRFTITAKGVDHAEEASETVPEARRLCSKAF
jgi:hypothetical protein